MGKDGLNILMEVAPSHEFGGGSSRVGNAFCETDPPESETNLNTKKKQSNFHSDLIHVYKSKCIRN